MAACDPRDIVRLDHLNPCILQSSHEGRVITAAQGRVRLLGGTEVALNSEMELHAPALKPASATLGKLRRLGKFLHPERAFVKGARLLFLSGRHSQLNVIDNSEYRFGHTNMLTEERSSWELLRAC
jgi:hypothetical protein